VSLEAGTYVSDLDANNPVVGDLTGQGDDHLRLLKSVLKATFPGGSKAFRFPTSAAEATGTVNVTFPDDQNKLFPVSASAASRTVNLPDPTSGSTVNEDAFAVLVVKTDSSVNLVTIDASGAQTINGATTLVLSTQWAFAWLIWAGSDDEWYAITGNYLALTGLAIAGATALTSPAAADVIPIYDDSGAVNLKITLENLFKVIALITAITTTDVAIDDIMVLSDTSASAAAKAATIQVLFNALNKLTAGTTFDRDNDFVPFFDASGTAALKATLANFFTGAATAGAVLGKTYSEYTASTSLTGNIPVDGTIPQSSEGDSIATAAITLKKSTNRVRVRFSGSALIASESAKLVTALFSDISANALNAVVEMMSDQTSGTTSYRNIAFEVEHAPATVGPITYSVRSGAEGATYNWNPATLIGACARATLVVEEINV
jgi:hypothetical protein